MAPSLRLVLPLPLLQGRERGGLREVQGAGRVRDVVAAAREYGGVEAERWVKVRMGFAGEEEEEGGL